MGRLIRIASACTLLAGAHNAYGLGVGLRTAMWNAAPHGGNGHQEMADEVVDVGGRQVTVPGTWLAEHSSLVESAGGAAAALKSTAANGRLSVAECYVLGIDPEDPNDDLKIAEFEMKDGKPVITLNHTEDGSGNSFLSRVKTLGKVNLGDVREEWREVPEGGDSAMRFFKVVVEMQ